jgi:hypothetical protein
MSVQRKIRRELIRTFRQSPRPLIDAVVAACDIPEINPGSIRPYPFEDLDPGVSKAMGSMLGWQIDLSDRSTRSFALLLDVATHLEPEQVWNWQLWRTRVRLDARSPAWLAVCVTHEQVLTAIRKAFDHEPANLPILVTPDAKVLAVPSRPAPRPPVAMRL